MAYEQTLEQLLKKKKLSIDAFESASLSIESPIEDFVAWAFKNIYSVPYPTDQVDPDIARYYHGIQHVTRAALFSVVFANLYRRYDDAHALQLTDTKIKYLMLAALMHDSGREGEDKDFWDKDSALLLYFLLTKVLKADHDTAIEIANVVANKELEQPYVTLVEKDNELVWSEVSELNPDYEIMRKLLHDADSLDIIRARDHFDANYLEFFQKLVKPVQLTILNTASTEQNSTNLTLNSYLFNKNETKAYYVDSDKKLIDVSAKLGVDDELFVNNHLVTLDEKLRNLIMAYEISQLDNQKKQAFDDLAKMITEARSLIELQGDGRNTHSAAGKIHYENEHAYQNLLQSIDPEQHSVITKLYGEKGSLLTESALKQSLFEQPTFTPDQGISNENLLAASQGEPFLLARGVAVPAAIGTTKKQETNAHLEIRKILRQPELPPSLALKDCAVYLTHDIATCDLQQLPKKPIILLQPIHKQENNYGINASQNNYWQAFLVHDNEFITLRDKNISTTLSFYVADQLAAKQPEIISELDKAVSTAKITHAPALVDTAKTSLFLEKVFEQLHSNYIKHGNPNRSTSMLGWGASVYARAGFLITQPDLTRIASIGYVDNDRGRGKKKRIPTGQDQEQVQKKLAAVQTKQKMGGSSRRFNFGNFVNNHSEIEYHLRSSDIKAVYFTKDPNCYTNDIQGGARVDLSHKSFLEAIFLQKEWLTSTGEELPLVELSGIHGHFKVRETPTEEDLLSMWVDSCAIYIKKALDDGTNPEQLTVDELKTLAVNDSLHGMSPLDTHYDTTLREKINEAIVLKRTELINTYVDNIQKNNSPILSKELYSQLLNFPQLSTYMETKYVAEVQEILKEPSSYEMIIKEYLSECDGFEYDGSNPVINAYLLSVLFDNKDVKKSIQGLLEQQIECQIQEIQNSQQDKLEQKINLLNKIKALESLPYFSEDSKLKPIIASLTHEIFQQYQDHFMNEFRSISSSKDPLVVAPQAITLTNIDPCTYDDSPRSLDISPILQALSQPTMPSGYNLQRFMDFIAQNKNSINDSMLQPFQVTLKNNLIEIQAIQQNHEQQRETLVSFYQERVGEDEWRNLDYFQREIFEWKRSDNFPQEWKREPDFSNFINLIKAYDGINNSSNKLASLSIHLATTISQLEPEQLLNQSDIQNNSPWSSIEVLIQNVLSEKMKTQLNEKNVTQKEMELPKTKQSETPKSPNLFRFFQPPSKGNFSHPKENKELEMDAPDSCPKLSH